MLHLKHIILLLLLPVVLFSTQHEYYVSVTTVEYAEDQKALQIISQIFIDDLENALRLRYNKEITLTGDEESKKNR